MKRFLLIIVVGLFVTTVVQAATITFNLVYPGTGTTYTINSASIAFTDSIPGSAFKFTSANPADVTFSGNNVAGQLSYLIAGQTYTINGLISRKVGNSTNYTAFFFAETTVLGGNTATGKAWLLIVPGNESAYYKLATESTNSAPVASSLNDFLTTQTSKPDPVITSSGGAENAYFSISENTTAVTTITATVYPAGGSGATAYLASTKTFSLSGGVDASKFTINSSTGVLSFISAPNYESPTDVGLNNIYDVQVTVTDSQGTTDIQNIAVTITNLNDALPVITSDGGGATATIPVTQGATAVTIVTATDADLGDVLTFSKSGGTNAALFNIDSSSGALTFISAATVGSYQVIVKVTDAVGDIDTQTLTINVTSSDITPPSLVITSADSNLSAGESTTITFNFSELVQGFTFSDVVVTGGTLGTITQSGTDPTLYTATFTQSGSGTAPSFNVAANTYQDMANNNGTAASLTLAYDVVPPTVIVSINGTNMAYGETEIVTFTFSENPGNTFSATDITVTNGLLTNLIQTADPKVWTASLKAISSLTGPSVTVQNLSYTDPAGNLGSSGTDSSTLVPPSIDLANTSFSDTGASSTDNTTKNRQPIIEGIYLEDNLIRITVISGGITYTYDKTITPGTFSVNIATETPSGYGGPITLASDYVSISVAGRTNTTTQAITAASSFFIDLTDPIAPTVQSKTDTDATPTITGTASVNDGEVLTVTVGGVTYTAGDGRLSFNSGTWSLAIPATNALTPASYPVTARVTDLAGNFTTGSGTYTMTSSSMSIDLENTSLSDTGTSNSDNITTNRKPIISGIAPLTDASATVNVISGGVTYTYNNVAVSSGTWSLNLTSAIPTSVIPSGNFPSEGLPNGTVNINITGNTSGAYSANTFVIDITAPTTPTVNSQSTFDTTPTITGSATVGAGDILRVTINGVTYTNGDGNLSFSSGTWSLTIPGGSALTVNAYPTSITVTDVAGNVATGNGTTTIRTATATIDLANTAGSDTGTSSTDNLTSNRKPVINGTASDDAVVTVTVTSNGTTYTYNNVAVSGGNWSLDLSTAATTSGAAFPGTGLTTGTATLAVTGNTSSATGSNSFIVDYSAPTTPTVNSLTTTDTTPTITGTATVSAGDVFTVNVHGVTYTNGDGHLSYSVGTWTLNIPTGNEIPVNTYTVLATVTDAAGNVSTNVSTNQLVIYEIIPDIQTYNITPIPTFTTATISWSKGNMSSRVVFMKEGTGTISNPVNSATYTSNTNWTLKGTQLAASGYYCIYNGTGTSVKVTGLYPGRTYTIQAFEYNGTAGSESYLTNVSGANNPVTVVPWPTTTFTNSPGVSSLETWNTSARWDHDTIPSSALHEAVLVYIDGNCEVTSAAECYNLTIKAAHSGIFPKLTINASKSMNVLGGPLGGQLINNGGTSALTVKSSSSVPNGSLIYASGAPSATVEMYSKANWNLDAAVNNKYYWQFFGIPVKTLAYSSAFNSNCFVREWDETVNDYDLLWKRRNDGSSLTLGVGSTLSVNKGYELVQAAPTTYSFAGELLNTDFIQSLPYTTNAVYPGQHIFGNPYPAAVDIEKIEFNSNTEKAIYQYNTGTYNQWLNNGGETTPDYSLDISPGQYTVSTPATAGSLGVLRQIPSMQGFLVKAMNNNSASFTIPFNSQVINSSQQRARQLVENSTDNRVATRIDIRSTHYADRVWIFTDPTCSRNYDNGWDGRKILGKPNASQLFVTEKDDYYQINAVKDMNETYLGFKPGEDIDFQLTVTHQNADNTYSAIYLIDLVDNKTIDVTASGTEYKFTAIANTPVSNRFKIVTPRVTTDSENNMLHVYNTNDAIFIQNLSSATGTLTLYNLSGVPVSSIKFIPSGISSITTKGLLSGAYLINAFTDNESAKAKIIIR